MKTNIAVFLALILAFIAPKASAQQRIPGELPVKSGFELVGRKALPTLTELEEILEKKEAKALLTGSIRVTDTNVYAPRWRLTGDRWALSFQKANLKQEQSKVVAQESLLKSPLPLVDDEYSYESMMIWAVGRSLPSGPAYGVVSNVSGGSQIHVGSLDSIEPFMVSSGETTKRHPATVVGGTPERPDVQVVFDSGKDLIARTVRNFTEENSSQGQRVVLGQGTQARWSLDGKQCVYVRELYGEGEYRDRVEGQEIVIFTRQLSAPVLVFSGEKGQILRSPIFSPDGSHVAFYLRRKGIDPVWDLYACDVRSQLNKAKRIGEYLVIDSVFEHVGPAWSGDSQSLYFFSQKKREEEYYPVQQVSRLGEPERAIQYPKTINVANDIHARSWGHGDFIVFTGIDRGPRELYFIVTSSGKKASKPSKDKEK
jgi:hypothetical protein